MEETLINLEFEAKKMESQGDWNKALTIWQTANKFFPEKMIVSLGVARCLMHLERFKESEDCFTTIRTRWPDRPGGYIGLANVLVRKGSIEDALDCWQAASKLFSENMIVSLGVARSLMLLARFKESEACFRTIRTCWPDRPEGYIGLANVLERQNNYENALECWQTASKLFSENIIMSIGVARCLMHLERFEESETCYTTIRTRWPGRPEGYIGLANVFEKQWNYEGAHKCWQTASKSFPKNIDIVLGLANCNKMFGDYDAAITLYKKVLKHSPNSWIAYLGLADVLALTGSNVSNALGKYSLENMNPREKDDIDRPKFASEIINRLVAQADLKRAPIQDVYNSEVLASNPGDSDITVLLFTGYANRLFGFPVTLFDRYFAYRGISTYYLKDLSGGLFFNGISSLGLSFDETVNALRKLCQNKPERRIFTIGASGAGHAAIRYGVALGAKGVLGLGAGTNLTEKFLEEVEDNRGKAAIRRLNKEFPAECLDLKPLLLSCDTLPKIDLVFAEDNRGDLFQADYLSEIPSVSLHPIKGYKDHNILPKIVGSGYLFDLLETRIK